MDIMDVMREDHDGAFALLAKLEEIADKDANREADGLVHQLTTEVHLHAKSEEIALYQALKRSNKGLREFALEGYHEHAALDNMLAKLATLTPGEDGDFRAAVTVCKAFLQHHAREVEEGELFGKLRKAFSQAERQAMGAAMEAEKERWRSRIGRSATPVIGARAVVY